jgi:hypothetical protein
MQDSQDDIDKSIYCKYDNMVYYHVEYFNSNGESIGGGAGFYTQNTIDNVYQYERRVCKDYDKLHSRFNNARVVITRMIDGESKEFKHDSEGRLI